MKVKTMKVKKRDIKSKNKNNVKSKKQKTIC